MPTVIPTGDFVADNWGKAESAKSGHFLGLG